MVSGLGGRFGEGGELDLKSFEDINAKFDVPSFDEWKAENPAMAHYSTQDGGGEIRSAFQYVDKFKKEFGRKGSDDPSFGIRLREGERSLARRQAASGNRLSGQAARELTEYGQEFASREFGAAHRRAMDRGRLLEDFTFAEYGLDRNQAESERAREIQTRQFSNDILTTEFDANRLDRDDEFNKLRTLAGMGAVEGTARLGETHATRAADTIIGGGDALARGRINEAAFNAQAKIARNNARAANRNAVTGTIGRLAGAAAGSFLGPFGAQAGAAAGEALFGGSSGGGNAIPASWAKLRQAS